MATYRALDLKLDLDRFAAPARYESGLILMEGRRPWDMVDHALAFTGHPCPICGEGEFDPGRDEEPADPLDGGPRKRRRRTSRLYCLGCDRCGLDGRVEFPGLDVGQCLDSGWHAEATVFVPEAKLKGGVGSSRATKARELSERVRRRRARG